MRAVILVLASLAMPALARDPAPPAAEGARLLDVHCAACHALDAGKASPLSTAPSFAHIAARYPPIFLEEALAEGIVTGHEGMPEQTFAPREIAAIVAYLETLRRE